MTPPQKDIINSAFDRILKEECERAFERTGDRLMEFSKLLGVTPTDCRVTGQFDAGWEIQEK